MKYVKLFESFKEEDIQAICKEYGIQDYTINPDGSIDVYSIISFDYRELKELPLKFGSVKGYFECSRNKLTTLEGAPNYVGSYFDCSYNLLTTLEGAPNQVSGNFYCEFNKILTFEGAPNQVSDLYCRNNPIKIIWDLFEDYSKVELLNDYDPLRIENEKGVCILSRLNGFLEDIGKSKLTDYHIKRISKYYEIR